MVELDLRRSAAKTLDIKMGLKTQRIFVLFNTVFILHNCRFKSYSEFIFHCFINFEGLCKYMFTFSLELQYHHVYTALKASALTSHADRRAIHGKTK